MHCTAIGVETAKQHVISLANQTERRGDSLPVLGAKASAGRGPDSARAHGPLKGKAKGGSGDRPSSGRSGRAHMSWQETQRQGQKTNNRRLPGYVTSALARAHEGIKASSPWLTAAASALRHSVLAACQAGHTGVSHARVEGLDLLDRGAATATRGLTVRAALVLGGIASASRRMASQLQQLREMSVQCRRCRPLNQLMAGCDRFAGSVEASLQWVSAGASLDAAVMLGAVLQAGNKQQRSDAADVARPVLMLAGVLSGCVAQLVDQKKWNAADCEEGAASESGVVPFGVAAGKEAPGAVAGVLRGYNASVDDPVATAKQAGPLRMALLASQELLRVALPLAVGSRAAGEPELSLLAASGVGGPADLLRACGVSIPPSVLAGRFSGPLDPHLSVWPAGSTGQGL